jgi:hypothetical protein
MAISKGGLYSQDRTIKKTRQGMGRGTKWGSKGSKIYKKKPRGQGK